MMTEKIISRDYRDRYSAKFEVEKEWLQLNAIERVNSIQQLLEKSNFKPDSILEIGCGTGAILRELQNRKIGNTYTGVDYSEEAIMYLRDNSENINASIIDITSRGFSLDIHYDLILLIHVLQHLEDPAAILKHILMKARFSYLIIEIPFEDTFLNKIVPLFHWRENNPASSLQFFNYKSFNRLLLSNNLKILEKRTYAPIYSPDMIKALKIRYGWSQIRYYKKILTSHILPKLIGPLKMRIHYSHCAVLCKKMIFS